MLTKLVMKAGQDIKENSANVPVRSNYVSPTCGDQK